MFGGDLFIFVPLEFGIIQLLRTGRAQKIRISRTYISQNNCDGETDIKNMKFFDLSVLINENTPVYPGDPKTKIQPAGIFRILRFAP